MEKIELSIERVDGVTYFNFKVPAKLTEIYKKQSQEIRESEAWPGHKFYYIPKVVESESYKSLCKNYHVFDNYGSKLVAMRSGESPYINIAWLRTVGGEGRIEMNDEIPIGELTRMAKYATQFIREYFQEYFSNAKLTGTISIEV